MSHFRAIVFLVFLAFGTSQAWSPWQKYHVKVVNGLRNDVLHAHCASGDNDLGQHVLPVNGEFGWGFRNKFPVFGKTLYFCTLSWRGGHRSFDVFTTYAKFVHEHCGGKECVWKAQEDGVYLLQNHKDFQLWYPWEH